MWEIPVETEVELQLAFIIKLNVRWKVAFNFFYQNAHCSLLCCHNKKNIIARLVKQQQPKEIGKGKVNLFISHNKLSRTRRGGHLISTRLLNETFQHYERALGLLIKKIILKLATWMCVVVALLWILMYVLIKSPRHNRELRHEGN